MVPRVDFDIVRSILRVLEGWELGNKGLYRKYQAYKKIIKSSKSYFGPGSPKNRFLQFVFIFLRKRFGNPGISSETTIPGISSETTIPGISSETTETRESRVRRPGKRGSELQF